MNCSRYIVSPLHPRVKVLEAKDQLGGRILTKPHGHGVVELAANSIHGVDSDNSVYSFAVAEGLGDLIIEGRAQNIRNLVHFTYR